MSLPVNFCSNTIVSYRYHRKGEVNIVQVNLPLQRTNRSHPENDAWKTMFLCPHGIFSDAANESVWGVGTFTKLRH